MARAEGSERAPHIRKSAAAYRTTGEAAAALDLPAHVLRFWESKFPQLKPLKRSGGRRYYRPQDIDLLQRIRQCLHQDGYTIRGVQKLLREGALGSGGPAAANSLETPMVLREDRPPADTPDRPVEPASPPLALRTALADLRRELMEIRALLGELLAR